jgi:citronellol/citronellal dehydrogenase
LRAEGVTDFSHYSSAPQEQLAADFFVPDEVFERIPTGVRKTALGAGH